MRRLPIAPVLAAAVSAALVLSSACADELSQPVTLTCDLQLDLAVDSVPATVSYIVAADGLATVSSVTFTTPVGDSTLTNPPDENTSGETYLTREAIFDSATAVSLRVMGEVSTGGQVGITYTVEPGQPEIAGPFRICGG
jgi:opacity protein-like surface antigen